MTSIRASLERENVKDLRHMRPLGCSPCGRISDRDSFLTALFDMSLHFPRFNEGGGRGQCTEAHSNTLLYCYVDDETMALQRIAGCGQNVLFNFTSGIWIFYCIYFSILKSSDVYIMILFFVCCFFCVCFLNQVHDKVCLLWWTWVWTEYMIRCEGNYWNNIIRAISRSAKLLEV